MFFYGAVHFCFNKGREKLDKRAFNPKSKHTNNGFKSRKRHGTYPKS